MTAARSDQEPERRMELDRRRFLVHLGQSLALGGTGLLAAACQSSQPPITVTLAPAGANPTPAPTTQTAAAPAASAAPASPVGSPAVAAPSLSPAVSASASPSPARSALAAVGKPMYQMDPQHTGRSPYTGQRRLGLLRTFDINQPELQPSDFPLPAYKLDIQSSTAVGPDGTIYATTFGGWLLALRDSPSARDRLDLAWRFRPANGSPLHGTAAVSRDGSTVYVPFAIIAGTEARGVVYAVRAPASGQDAQVVWQADLGGLVNNSVTLGPDGTLYIVNLPGLLSAIDPSDGRVKWTAQTGSSGPAPFGQTCKVAPALGPDGTVYVTAVTGSLYAVSPPAGSGTQGSVRWSFDFGQHLGPTPLVSTPVTDLGNRGQDAIGSAASATMGPDGTIYVGADNSNFYAIDPNGQQKWLFEAERELAGIWTTAALSPDAETLYFGANKGGVYALNTRNGSRKWQYRIEASVYSSPALDAAGTLYTGSTVGHVLAINSADGQLVADYNAGAAVWTAPSIRPDGTLVVGTRNGRILVLGEQS